MYRDNSHYKSDFLVAHCFVNELLGIKRSSPFVFETWKARLSGVSKCSPHDVKTGKYARLADLKAVYRDVA